MAVKPPEGEIGIAHPRDALASRRTGQPRPLSSAQERLWFLDRIEPGSTTYNLATAWSLVGELNTTALEGALNSLIERHQVLRTTYHTLDGQPAQIVSPLASLKLELIDLRTRNLGADSLDIRRIARDLAWRPYDLSRDLMLRASVLRLKDDEQVLLIGRHHIASDGWSNQILFGELTVLYHCFLDDAAPSLAPLPYQYADFAADERAWFRDAKYEAQLAYWKKTLDGMPPVFELPADRPRPARPDYAGAAEEALIPQSLRQALTVLGRSENCTLFMVLLAAFQLLLSRLAGETDVSIGCAVANRQDQRIEKLIGFFVNTLVLRTNLSGDPSFRELMIRARTTAMEALSHQAVPFDRLVAELRVERDLTRNPLVDVLINFVDRSSESLALRGLSASLLEIDDHPAHLSLTLEINRLEQGLRLRFGYRRALYQPARIRSLLEQFHGLLNQIVQDPGRPIGSYAVDSEGSRIPLEWNATEAPYPSHATLHELFEAQVKRTPDAPAVVFEGRALNFGDLNRAANRLARRLRTLGVGPESLVGLAVERSVEMVVAVMGILKAGGGYVPLDPRLPRARLAEAIAEAGLGVVVSSESVRPGLPPGIRQVVSLDGEAKTIAEYSDEDLPPSAAPENVAYMLFTSGSTGKPKGVLIEHRPVVNYVAGVARTLGLRNLAGFALAQPLTVDSSVTTLYASLLHGGCLHVISEELALDAQGLSEYFRRHPIDYLKIAPSHLAALHAAGGENILPRRVLILGGEASRWESVRRYQDRAPGCAIYNHYGPTETTVGVTTFRIPDGIASSASGFVPIGRPLPNTTTYILDGRMRQVPPGVTGELYLGGDCLARGYLNQPELTADAFVRNPFDNRRGARLYKTGDMARYLPDGNIEFLGRRDSQVKIRGFRVELGEVESAIARHPEVQDVAVTADERKPGDLRLVAYVAAKGSATLSESRLREFLLASVPAHLVPSAFAFVESLPRTSHGKLDHAALRRGGIPVSKAECEEAKPRDAMETRLTRIWEDVLGVRPVGIRDNFFSLGGHSLLAVSLLAKIERAFGKKLPLRILFEAPTIEHLSAVLRREGWPSQWPSLIPIQPAGRKLPFFCVHGVRGNVLFYADLARHMGGERPVYGLQSAGVDGTGEQYSRMEDMAAAYIRELKDVQPEGPYLLGGFCSGAYVALEMAHQLQQQGDRVALLVSFTTDGTWRLVESSFGGGLNYHWRNLKPLSGRGKLAYLAARARYRCARIAGVFSEGVSRIYVRLGKPVPASLRALQVERVNRRANQNYRPRPYRGRLLYFQGRDEVFRDPVPFWGNLVDSVKVDLIPGKAMAIFREPNVPFLAERLKAHLDQAEIEAARESPQTVATGPEG